MKTPSFTYERQYWQQDISFVAGLDEVGMGAWAGPVVAGAVVFEKTERVQRGMRTLIRDSKLLSPEQREKAAGWVREHSLAWAVGEASVEEIFELNILQAARLAMRRAVKKLSQQPDFLLVDGYAKTLHPTIPHQSVVKGDQKSFSIAAASIVAKVYRDTLMCRLAEEFPGYGFESHKGYGSRQHQEALRAQGACPCHRAGYAPIRATLDSGAVLHQSR